jgi:hypothetical protein
MLAGAGCGSGPAGAPVRLDAGPAVAALVDPVHVSVSGLPPAGLVTVQARALDRQGQPWVSAARSARPAARQYFGFPPYFPVFTTTEVAALGGSAQADALATEQFWTRMIAFLNHLAVHQPTPS